MPPVLHSYQAKYFQESTLKVSDIGKCDMNVEPMMLIRTNEVVRQGPRGGIMTEKSIVSLIAEQIKAIGKMPWFTEKGQCSCLACRGWINWRRVWFY